MNRIHRYARRLGFAAALVAVAGMGAAREW